MKLIEFYDELLKVHHNPRYASCLVRNLYDMEAKSSCGFSEEDLVLSLLTEHFDLVIRYCRNNFSNIIVVIDDLYSRHVNLELFFRKNLCKILGIVHDEYDLEYLVDCFLNNWNLDMDFVEECLNREFDRILQSYSFSFVYALVVSEIRFTEENRDKLREYLRNNREKYIFMLLFSQCGNESVSSYEKDYEKDLKNVVSVVTMIVDEVLEQEQADYIDIEKISGGCFSDVIMIGDKIIKVGREKGTYCMPYDKGMIESIIRVNLFDYSNIHGVIEVMERVDTKTVDNLNIEDLYCFYRDGRRRGVVYADLKFDNIGILQKDNVIHWDKLIGKEISARGITGTRDSDCLKAGSMVCFDMDFLYTEEEYQRLNSSRQGFGYILDSLSPFFEDRYQKELNGSYFEKDRDMFYDEVGEFLQKQEQLLWKHKKGVREKRKK